MEITKNIVIDQITITENGIVLYREATRIKEGDKQLSETYHRYSLYPSQNLDGVPKQVVDICNLIWTQDVINKFNDNINSSNES